MHTQIQTHKIDMYMRPLSLSPSLSISHSHTQTHTNYCCNHSNYVTIRGTLWPQKEYGKPSYAFNPLPGATSKNVRAGPGQNVPKRPVMIGKLRCFHTRKFLYNLTRISWIITVQDFRYFLPRHLHCLCVRSESERVFLSRVEETRSRFLRQISSTIQTTTNDSMAFVLKILCFEKL